MVERLHFLAVYIGSAAMAAFLAACLTSPRIAMFACAADGATSAEQCELTTVVAVAPAAGDPNAKNLTADVANLVPLAMSAAP